MKKTTVMNKSIFYKQLAIVSIIAGLILVGFSFIPQLQSTIAFGWIYTAFMIIWSIVMYTSGRKAALNPNKNKFTNVIMGSTMGKLFLSAAIVVAYFLIFKPDSKFFLISFFVVYILFTIFETRFMLQLSKTPTKDEGKI